MVNSSKVLTVSYGTFSCTLEGFDDSFDTMKAIAEYFRDLAADDRYFGAEPPTPDADMLARIAEREVSRRVEAHQDGGNIVLRTSLPVADTLIDNSKDEAEIAAGAAKAVAESEALDQARLEDIAQQEAEAQAEAAQAEKDAEAKAEAEAKAAADAQAKEKAEAKAARKKARRERFAQKAKADAEAAEAEAARIALEKEEAEAASKAEAEAEAAAKAEAEALAQAEAEAHAKAAAEAEANAKAESEAEAHRIAEAEAARQAEEEQPEPDSVAAKLARIRAVVGKPVSSPATPSFSEDEHADDIQQGQPGDTDLEDILELDDAEANGEDTISGVMARLSADAAPKDIEAPLEADAAVAQEAPKEPIRARVIKMKREEFEAAIASGDIEEDIDEADLATEDTTQTSLSRDAEDELARELAAVEAELAGLQEDDNYDDEDTADYAPVQEHANAQEDLTTARGLDDLAVAPDIEMDRLMDQASSELEEPDGKKRRNALGHLRAAVASARADKEARPEGSLVDETLDYRDDLESAVQPRRPVRRLSAETATDATRAPLKLVAEQRVDSAQQPPVAQEPIAASAPVPQPVRPRRIKADTTQPTAPTRVSQDVERGEAGDSFSEFAEEMGATELPDLLEAAAAYLAYIEGKDQFSRPQLMTKVRMVQEEDFSREDGLRSFGQLLRQGKIEKISGGRFTISDRISFKPDTRAAG